MRCSGLLAEARRRTSSGSGAYGISSAVPSALSTCTTPPGNSKRPTSTARMRRRVRWSQRARLAVSRACVSRSTSQKPGSARGASTGATRAPGLRDHRRAPGPRRRRPRPAAARAPAPRAARPAPRDAGPRALRTASRRATSHAARRGRATPARRARAPRAPHAPTRWRRAARSRKKRAERVQRTPVRAQPEQVGAGAAQRGRERARAAPRRPRARPRAPGSGSCRARAARPAAPDPRCGSGPTRGSVDLEAISTSARPPGRVGARAR